MNYELHYAKLNLNDEDIELINFKSWSERKYFIEDKILCYSNDKVFLLAIEYSKDLSNIHIFDRFCCILNFKNNEYKWGKLYLFEFESYEEAYKVALDIKESETNLAYNQQLITKN
tara:strand:+ start:57 stop:404 length:348 start_codon:yes stop_codon:yes gene_type:complete